MITAELLAQIRKTIDMEDEQRQRVPESDLKPVSQNSRHRRVLLAEVDRLRELVNSKGLTVQKA